MYLRSIFVEKMKKLWSTFTTTKRSKSSSKSKHEIKVDRERFEATASLIRRTVKETSNEAATEMICHLLYDGVIKEILAQIQFGGDDAIRVAVKSNVLSSVLECVEKYCASEQT